jgi:hypothetical protein
MSELDNPSKFTKVQAQPGAFIPGTTYTIRSVYNSNDIRTRVFVEDVDNDGLITFRFRKPDGQREVYTQENSEFFQPVVFDSTMPPGAGASGGRRKSRRNRKRRLTRNKNGLFRKHSRRL